MCTGDASGDQGATVTMLDPLEGELREVWHYGPEESAPQQSSNYRELDTVLKVVELWGERLEGRRVLVRSDNKQHGGFGGEQEGHQQRQPVRPQ